MAIFSVNQARQIYVAVGDLASAATDIKKGGTPGKVFIPEGLTGTDFYVQAVNGVSEPLRSDRVQPGRVTSVSLTKAKKPVVNKYKISLDNDILNSDGNVPRGYNFIVKVLFDHFIGMTEVDKYSKLGEVYTKKAMTPADFYEALCFSLQKNFQNENKIYPICEVTHDGTGVTLTECVQDWHLGTMASEVLPFHVEISGVLMNGVVVDWATVTKDSEDAKDPRTGEALTNGRTIADMEYFYLGERGDIYRNIGWPNVIPTKYLVDPSKEYDVLDIQYFWAGDNEDIQHSAKTLTVVAESGKISEAKVKSIGELLGLTKVFIDGKITPVE